MTVQATGIFSNNAIGNIGKAQNDEQTPKENWQTKLQQSNVWDFSGYFNGTTASTAYQG